MIFLGDGGRESHSESAPHSRCLVEHFSIFVRGEISGIRIEQSVYGIEDRVVKFIVGNILVIIALNFVLRPNQRAHFGIETPPVRVIAAEKSRARNRESADTACRYFPAVRLFSFCVFFGADFSRNVSPLFIDLGRNPRFPSRLPVVFFLPSEVEDVIVALCFFIVLVFVVVHNALLLSVIVVFIVIYRLPLP